MREDVTYGGNTEQIESHVHFTEVKVQDIFPLPFKHCTILLL